MEFANKLGNNRRTKGYKMKKNNTMARKFKAAGLITLVVGGMAVAGMTYNKQSKSYDVQLKKELSKMSVDQLKAGIKECDIALNRLYKEINSKEIAPEDQFYAKRAYEAISKERASWCAQLDKINAQKGKTIHLYDVDKSR